MSIATLMPAPNSVIKGVKKYLQQAVRLDKVEPLVAYYCRMYAMQQAIGVKNGKTKEDMKVLGGLMTWLEQQKQLKAVPKEEAKMRCEAFALNVFTHADNEDRKAPASAPEWKAVALSFHAAYVFMDVCKQFGALDKEFASRALYAKWKTADIFKALADNRLPKPGSFSEQNGGGGGGGLEDELAALEREEQGEAAAPAAAAPAKPKPVASPPPAAAAAAASASNAQVPNFGVPKPAAPATAAPKPAVAAPAPAAPAASAASAPAYPSFEASSYVPLDDHHMGPAPVVVVPHAAAPNTHANAGVSDADINAFMAPAAVPAARPAVNPAAYAPAAASAPAYGGGGGGGGGLNLPRGAIVVVPKASAEVGDAVHECEKLLRHAQSALNFEDADTAVAKLKDALALLLPYRKKL